MNGEVGAEGANPGPEWQRTNPLAVVVSAIRGLQQALLPIAAILFGSSAMGDSLWITVLILVAIVAINMLIAYLAWRRLRYRVGSSDIKMEKGLISRKARSVPYERIQDVSLEQSPIPRLLGLVEVRFETGAGGKDELKLAYVSMEEGERLREVVRDQREGALAEVAVDQAADDMPAIQPAGEVLFAMPPRRLLLFGLFEFSLVVIAVLGGAAQQFDFILPFDLWDFEQWEQRLAGPGAWLFGLGWASRIVGAIFAVLTLFLIGLLTGVVRTFLRDWDFRLEKTPKGFRRRRGLLTKTDVVMPIQRVQAVSVGTGLLRRIWGWHGLSFISLAQDAKSANHVVAPFAQMDEIAPIVQAANFDLPGGGIEWHQPSRNYWVDNALMGGVPATLAAVAALVAAESLWIGLGLAVFAAFIVIRQYYLWQVERHALDAKQILSRRGWLAPSIKLANRVKLHSVEIAQGPIAKWRGYADLKFGLAGGTLTFAGLPVEEARAMRAAVLESIASVDFSKLAR